ncbi:HSP20 family protein [Flagellimonas taeanensis]|jgi:HSP20 family protein|uniref:HSP20 family protein n=1 Tax=Flagellimonas taeanensis TaxID=1005926 RepID=A0A1M6PE08_9FLAO|nr:MULTISPECIES: Hsp20/alpha crystallin family protein [Allomuricauda]MEE1961230.1 Hsp20/alpha crystallin family protein [Allomuricauda taeanensis]SFB66652.1 HSP20 family protein [Allomuricauda taeanensis]SHK06154.1 HSP20 family protein [Allomuricauda taeanensis]
MSNLVATKNGSVAKSNSNGLTFPMWSSWIDEMFNKEIPTVFTSNFNTGITLPKVNIRETKDSYYVEMAVPGLKKSDFMVDLDNKILSISADAKTEAHENEGNLIRKEFGYSSFKRSFSLPETVNEDKIKAEYRDGILSIHLPKLEEAIQKPARTIKIA